jgi:predicted nucleotidyltransferase
LYYRTGSETFETIVDIIPFGHLETEAGMIAWPPDSEVVMNVVAFSDAYKSATTVELDAELTIPVTSLAGLMVLKLFAWLDRHENRDVQDIRKLLETYTDAGNVDRLYEEEEEQLKRDEFDTALSGAFLLGKDVRRITDEKVRHELGTLLTDDARSNLATQLARTISILEDRTEPAEALLSHFFEGLGPL